MAFIPKANLFDAIPKQLPQEWFETLTESGGIKIERIVSKGHASDQGYWYDQAWDEWVLLLKGSAGLRLEGDRRARPMAPGDWVLIPAHVKHRVDWTAADTETVWLAVHFPAVGNINRREEATRMDTRTYQQILKDAIQAEIEAHQFYQAVADKVTDNHLRSMFLSFADEELKHRRILEGFKEKPDMSIHFDKVPDFHLSETMAATQALSMNMKPSEAIALAMKKEEAAMRHYTQLADACGDAAQQKVFR
jgi:cupin 2 domain-containing protein